MIGLFGPASAMSLGAVTLRGGDVEVSPIHLRTPPGRKSGGSVLSVVPSMEAPSWEVLLFGGEMMWVMDLGFTLSKTKPKPLAVSLMEIDWNKHVLFHKNKSVQRYLAPVSAEYMHTLISI